MWDSILGLYIYVGIVWACETGYYWYLCAKDDFARARGLFSAVLSWPYEVVKGVARKFVGLQFFKEID